MRKTMLFLCFALPGFFGAQVTYGQSPAAASQKIIRSYFLQEDNNWGSMHLVVLQFQGTKVTGYFGWTAQTTNESYIDAKLTGNLITGKKISLYDGASEPFSMKYGPTSITTNTVLGIKKIAFTEHDFFSTGNPFILYEAPNKNARQIESEITLNDKGCELLEIGKVEKFSDEFPTHGIWYKIRLGDGREGWVFELVHVI